jgi:hypothetical protein
VTRERALAARTQARAAPNAQADAWAAAVREGG